MSRSRKLIVGFMVAVGALMWSPLPASAAYDAATCWTDCNTGYGKFQAYGEHVWACDYKNDGLKVGTHYQRYDTGSQAHYWVLASGAGDCGDRNLSMPEGTYIKIYVCLGTGTEDHFEPSTCSTTLTGQA